jgi:hypothetical protein
MLTAFLWVLAFNLVDSQKDVQTLTKYEGAKARVYEVAKEDFSLTIQSDNLYSSSGWCFKEYIYRYTPKHDFVKLETYQKAIEEIGSDKFHWRTKVKQEGNTYFIEAKLARACVNF